MLRRVSTAKMARLYSKPQNRSYNDSPRNNSSRGSQTIVKHANQQKNSPLPLRLLPHKMPLSNSSSKRSRASSTTDERPSKIQKKNVEPSELSVLVELGTLSDIVQNRSLLVSKNVGYCQTSLSRFPARPKHKRIKSFTFIV